MNGLNRKCILPVFARSDGVNKTAGFRHVNTVIQKKESPLATSLARGHFLIPQDAVPRAPETLSP